MKVGGRDWSDADTSKEHLEPQEAGIDKEDSSWSLQGSPADFELLDTRTVR